MGGKNPRIEEDRQQNPIIVKRINIFVERLEEKIETNKSEYEKRKKKNQIFRQLEFHDHDSRIELFCLVCKGFGHDQSDYHSRTDVLTDRVSILPPYVVEIT